MFVADALVMVQKSVGRLFLHVVIYVVVCPRKFSVIVCERIMALFNFVPFFC